MFMEVHMGKKEILVRELEEVPEPYIDEVLDFVHYLKIKIVRDGVAMAKASESSLGKDWLRPEEDEAWRGL